MTARTLVAATAAAFALSTVTEAQTSFTLDDLLPGGSTYEQLRPEDRDYHWEGNTLVEGKKEEKKCEQLPDEARHIDLSDVSGHRAYTVKGNLFVLTADGQTLQVSTDGSTDDSENIAAAGDLIDYLLVFIHDADIVSLFTQLSCESRSHFSAADHNDFHIYLLMPEHFFMPECF